MKHYDYYEPKKKQAKEWKREHTAGGFKCSHCKQFVPFSAHMGTANRNHCNWCLWSKHVDEAKGDRRSHCHGGMRPIALTFKHEGFGRVGEIMLVHCCALCKKLSINRVARDDPEHSILAIFTESLQLENPQKVQLAQHSIDILTQDDRQVLMVQLFGNGGS